MTFKFNLILGLIVALLAGCAVIPMPLTETEIREQTEADSTRLTAGQEPASGPISLYEAIARAITYNLDLHVELAEKLLARSELSITRYDELPALVNNFAYAGRSNFTGANSRSLLTGQESLVSSTSSARDIFTDNLNLSWNVLDFGVSYFRAQQAADRVNIAEEQRRKVLAQLVQDVRSTYWRAVSNERLSMKLDEILERVNRAIDESKQVELNRLDRPLTALTYQRELLTIKQELQELKRELSLAKIQLAALMNIKPGEDFELELPDRSKPNTQFEFSPQLMETLALQNRSELREVLYQKRINAIETKTALLELLPGIDINFGANYDSNDFLFNNDWLNYGSRISWNLVNIFKYPATKRLAETRDAVLDAQRLALSMAILTQVHISIAQYEHSTEEFQTAADYFNTQQSILQQIYAAEQANSISEQTVIREEMNTLIAEVRYDVAYAEIENAYANTYSAIGFDPVPFGVGQQSIKELTETIKLHFENLNTSSGIFSLKVINP